MIGYLKRVTVLMGLTASLALAGAGPANAQSIESAQVEAAVEAVMPDVILWRRDFHRHPELGFAEHRTAEVIATRDRSRKC